MTSPHVLGFLPLAVSLLAQQRLFILVAILLEAIVLGMIVYSAWAVIRVARNQPLLPAPFAELPPATWGLGTILTIITLYVVTGMAAADLSRELLGIKIEKAIQELKGETAEAKPASVPAAGSDTTDKTKPGSPAKDDAADVAKKKADGEGPEHSQGPAAAARDLMALNACHMVLFLAAFPWFFKRCAGTNLDSLGLTGRNWPQQIHTGLATALIATPSVYIVQFLAQLAFRAESHPVEKMLQDQFSPSTAILAVTSAVVLAPLAEETLFRGVLQGWLSGIFQTSKRSSPPPASPAVAPDEGAPGPSSFVPAEPDFAVREKTDSGGPDAVCWPAVVMTSVLFAALHSPQWPAPIALFFFSMILGVAYQRTGSLLTAITTHGVFNAFSTLMMLVQQLGGDLQGVKDAVPAPAAFLWWLAGIPS